MNYERILFTGISGAITFMLFSVIFSGEGLHNYFWAFIGFLFGGFLSWTNQYGNKKNDNDLE